MKKKLICILISILIGPCLAQPSAKINDLSGSYICEGYDPFVKVNYKMPVTVTKTEATYQFETTDQATKEKYIGTGIYNPKNPSILAVIYRALSEDYATVGLYQVEQDGSFSVIWTTHGEKQAATEICKKVTS